MAAPAGLTLAWNGQALGHITDVQVDWPWAYGRFEAGDWPSDLRAAIEWLARQADSDDDLTDPPYPDEFYEGWSVVNSGGTFREIGAPVVDFVNGSIGWR